MKPANQPRDEGNQGAPLKFLPWAEMRVLLCCLALALLWIFFFDAMVDPLIHDPVVRPQVRMHYFRALNFAGTATALLLVVLRRGFNASRRYEQQLHEVNERFEFAGRAATDAIWEWNLVTNAVSFGGRFY